MKYEDLERVNQTLKTTDIKGKDYVEVNQRIKAFRMLYPEGTIQTEILQNIDGVVVIKAIVGYYNEDNTFRVLGTGMAYEKENSSFINKTSYIENCETSAIGRALGMLGIGIETSVASAEEVANAINNQNRTVENDYKQELKEYVEQHNLDIKEVCNKYGLTGKSTQIDFRTALVQLKVEEKNNAS
jgi:hypothetical protein